MALRMEPGWLQQATVRNVCAARTGRPYVIILEHDHAREIEPMRIDSTN
jgi:hypothetical protein